LYQSLKGNICLLPLDRFKSRSVDQRYGTATLSEAVKDPDLGCYRLDAMIIWSESTLNMCVKVENSPDHLMIWQSVKFNIGVVGTTDDQSPYNDGDNLTIARSYTCIDHFIVRTSVFVE
jgi:hypothetical protein